MKTKTDNIHAPKGKFRIEGAFCANCAAKMERALSEIEGIGETNINFATKTVWLPPEDRELAQSIMEKIEPGIKLVAIRPHNTENVGQEDGMGQRGKLLRILAAFLLFAASLVFVPALPKSLRNLEYLTYLSAYFLVGYEVLEKAMLNILRGSVFDENFLMTVATIGAIAIHQLPEAVGVMLFYAVGEYVEDRAVNRSRHSIQALLDIRPDYANLIHQLDVLKVEPEDVQVGQQILVRPGERVPLDGEVLNGVSFVDTSALTGEPVPRKVECGDLVFAGSVNQSGVLTLKVVHDYAESSVQKILDLVENASSRKAQTEKFITTFSRYYTPFVVLVALGIALIPPLLGEGQFTEWLYRAMTILVISCPCALVVSVPLGYFGGIGGASRQGILIKGANFLEALNQVHTVVFDKTGTLTQGVFEVVKIEAAPGFTPEKLLEMAAYAEAHSNHPIAKSIRSKYLKELDTATVTDYEEISGKGIHARIGGADTWVGKVNLLGDAGIMVPDAFRPYGAGTVVHVGISGCYAGYIMIADRLRKSSPETIKKLNQAGIKTVMLTGDQRSAAEKVAAELGVNEWYSDLLPEDKVTFLEKIMAGAKNKKEKVAFVGDGINDAPVLSRADLGIAMGGLGSDAAIEAADVVLMEDDPHRLLTAINIAGFTRKIIWQNIGFAILIKLFFITLGALGLANMWEAVFADTGVALLAILNATRVRMYSVRKNDVNHRLVQCEKCSQKLRVPINKGKIKVTCPECCHEFFVTT